ncbi:hypothetical protein POF51_26220 [Brevibacillus sp. AG]|uniref:hypothetical protein n=1 Tax=Brevibacillus sp. AG TaxID=3020891 RepID=UPI00232D64D9|nr:hypothetical protein [Brevibacillus sp. AG]MDC0764220.1 hypothetical protein [Brevibacillus sp. AG]
MVTTIFTILFGVMTLLSLVFALYHGLKKLGISLATFNVSMLVLIQGIGISSDYFLWSCIMYVLVTIMTMRMIHARINVEDGVTVIAD